MAGTKKRDGDSEGDSGFVTPDSTTKENVARFAPGDEVLSHGKDGLIYLGKVVSVDCENERYFVQFEDRTSQWSLFKDTTKFNLPDSDELCAICKSSKSYDYNEIVLCYFCEKGFHQNCVQPAISDMYCEPDSKWECPHCVCESAMSKEEKKKSRENSPRKQKIRRKPPEQESFKLPYDLKSLTWNPGHKSNKEETYCYCGGPGEWYNRMLQCHKCHQWFHEVCIESLHFNLLYGDRFYVFVCQLCNDNSEFLYRLHLTWDDVVHLALFNLYVHDSKTYFEFDQEITTWINDNWELLQCPFELQDVPVSDRERIVLKVLQDNSQRFRCGKEVRKRGSSWGLRKRIAPPVPIIILPDTPCITDLKNVQFKYKKFGSSPPFPRVCRIKKEKLDNPEDSHIFSPAKKRPVSPTYHLYSEDKEDEHVADCEDEEGNSEAEEEIASRILRKRTQEGTENSAPSRKRKRELDILMEDKKGMFISNIGDIRSAVLGKLTCKVQMSCNNAIYPAKTRHPGSKWNNSGTVFHVKAKKMIEEVGSFKSSPQSNGHNGNPPLPSSEDFPTDIKRKRGRPCSKGQPEASSKVRGSGTRPLRHLHHRRKKSSSESHKEINIGGDTSGDDTSSHGTLESFIPPPSNFEGNNNPFLNLDAPIYGLPTVRPLTLKRKLSENDIKIGKNGEIKRRRYRRKLDKSKKTMYLMPSSTLSLGTVGNGAFQLNGSVGSIRNCVDYALNSRFLSCSKADALLEESSVKVERAYSLSDLKSTVNTYFGAVNRIANGEKFHILAKRVTNEDQSQYLIEWEMPGS